MFTGIITAVAGLTSTKLPNGNLVFTIERPADWDELTIGESVATNGVCLTVTVVREDSFDMELMPETLRVSSFGQRIPKSVNLERALRLSDRLSGHFVQGHVDTVGTVQAVNQSDGYELTIEFPNTYQPWVIHKGSITIDGVALTITQLEDDQLTVALIPHTLQHTTIAQLKAGDTVNLEFDMIGKYIHKMGAV